MSRNPLGIIAVAALLATAAFSSAVRKTPATPAHATAVSDTGPVFDVSQLDSAVSACTDLSAFVNNRWVAANPIPPDRTRWGAFDELSERSLDEQHEIVGRRTGTPTPPRPARSAG